MSKAVALGKGDEFGVKSRVGICITDRGDCLCLYESGMILGGRSFVSVQCPGRLAIKELILEGKGLPL